MPARNFPPSARLRICEDQAQVFRNLGPVCALRRLCCCSPIERSACYASARTIAAGGNRAAHCGSRSNTVPYARSYSCRAIHLHL